MKFITSFLLNLSFINGYCYAPNAPSCLQYANNFNYSTCKYETENYLRELNEYYSCATGELANFILLNFIIALNLMLVFANFYQISIKIANIN